MLFCCCKVDVVCVSGYQMIEGAHLRSCGGIPVGFLGAIGPPSQAFPFPLDKTLKFSCIIYAGHTEVGLNPEAPSPL